jgi:hypothetical protein
MKHHSKGYEQIPYKIRIDSQVREHYHKRKQIYGEKKEVHGCTFIYLTVIFSTNDNSPANMKKNQQNFQKETNCQAACPIKKGKDRKQDNDCQ